MSKGQRVNTPVKKVSCFLCSKLHIEMIMKRTESLKWLLPSGILFYLKK